MDYDRARLILTEEFPAIEAMLLAGGAPAPIDHDFTTDLATVCNSDTLAYREALMGSLLARLQDKQIDLHLPYVGHGANAYQGRELDTRVINPFLQDQRIPATRGAFLSKFRRSVRFDASLKIGTRDQTACDAFLRCVDFVQAIDDDETLVQILRHLLHTLAVIREQSQVPINRIQRFNLDQYRRLIETLNQSRSGGRFPLFIVVAAFRALASALGADWTVDWQQINAADQPSGAVGDVTVRSGDETLVAAEVTERVVDRPRLVATFNVKIGPAALRDYLFFTTATVPNETHAQAYQYFAQGHEISFLDIAEWASNILGTIGATGRGTFNDELLAMLDDHQVPQAVKAAWNQAVDAIVAG